MGYRQRNDVEKSCEWAIEDVFIAARRVTDNSRIKGLMDVLTVSFSRSGRLCNLIILYVTRPRSRGLEQTSWHSIMLSPLAPMGKQVCLRSPNHWPAYQVIRDPAVNSAPKAPRPQLSIESVAQSIAVSPEHKGCAIIYKVLKIIALHPTYFVKDQFTS